MNNFEVLKIDGFVRGESFNFKLVWFYFGKKHFQAGARVWISYVIIEDCFRATFLKAAQYFAISAKRVPFWFFIM